MKKHIILSLLILSAAISRAQIIKGKVLDNTTHKGVPAAYIYFNGTMAVALSDVDGNFELNISKYRDMPLSISAIGYQSITLANPAKENSLTVLLTPKTYGLKEIKVVAKAKKSNRAKYLKLFKQEFLGLNYEQRNCIIENEEDITFTEEPENKEYVAFTKNSDKNRLVARAKKPIQIINKKLGYKITFYLDVFSHNHNTKETVCGGNFLFTDLALTDSTLKPEYDYERYATFVGSRLQFFRSLWCNSLSTTRFYLLNAKKELLNPKDVVIEEDSMKYLYHTGNIYVRFCSLLGKSIDSKISFSGKRVYFNSNGYFDGRELLWDGFMGNQRMADFLPYDYKPIMVGLDLNRPRKP